MFRVGFRAAVFVVAISSFEFVARAARSRLQDLQPWLLMTVALTLLAGLTAGLISRWLRPSASVAVALLGPTFPFALTVLWRLDRFLPSTDRFAVLLAASMVTAAVALGYAWLSGLRWSTPVMVALALGVFSVSLLVRWPGLPEVVPARPMPDMILLVMDTTRWDHLSLYGYERQTSPHLDAFAAGAQVYEDAWSVSPWTPPSHASMLTGLLPAEHGVDGQAQPPLPPGMAYLPEVLQRHGYRTAAFVANPNLLAPGWERGFEEFRGSCNLGYHTLIRLADRLLCGSANPWLMKRSSERILSLARRWWSNDLSRPRFLLLNLMDPHRPYEPPAQFYRRFLPGITGHRADAIEQDPVPYHVDPGLTAEDAAILNGLYDGEIAAMDEQIGAFFGWLDGRQELDSTLVVVTADHGERLGERGLVGHDLVMDQFLLKVPLVIRYLPEVRPSRVTRRVQLDGLSGYLLHLAGIEPPPVMEATALDKRLLSVAVAQYQDPGWFRDRVGSAFPDFDLAPFRGDSIFATEERFAFARREGGRPILVDLVADPMWAVDVAAEHPAVAKKLEALASELPAFGEVRRRQIDPATRERLKALGYVD